MAGLSVLILTSNEERNLPDCLASVRWSDDVVVYDSFSTDRTMELARSAGARCFQRRFDHYAGQRNASLREPVFQNPWVLVLDADERVTPGLRTELEATVAAATPEMTLFRMRRKDYFLGRWLRRSSGYPTWFPRLLRPDKVWVEREINEEFHTEGQVGTLREHIIHLPFNKGVDYRDPVLRRKHQKQLAYRLPCRPWLVFSYLYVARLGFLDGYPGFCYCRLRTLYEFMIDLKIRELRQRAGNRPV